MFSLSGGVTTAEVITFNSAAIAGGVPVLGTDNNAQTQHGWWWTVDPIDITRGFTINAEFTLSALAGFTTRGEGLSILLSDAPAPGSTDPATTFFGSELNTKYYAILIDAQSNPSWANWATDDSGGVGLDLSTTIADGATQSVTITYNADVNECTVLLNSAQLFQHQCNLDGRFNGAAFMGMGFMTYVDIINDYYGGMKVTTTVFDVNQGTSGGPGGSSALWDQPWFLPAAIGTSALLAVAFLAACFLARRSAEREAFSYATGGGQMPNNGAYVSAKSQSTVRVDDPASGAGGDYGVTSGTMEFDQATDLNRAGSWSRPALNDTGSRASSGSGAKKSRRSNGSRASKNSNKAGRSSRSGSSNGSGAMSQASTIGREDLQTLRMSVKSKYSTEQTAAILGLQPPSEQNMRDSRFFLPDGSIDFEALSPEQVRLLRDRGTISPDIKGVPQNTNLKSEDHTGLMAGLRKQMKKAQKGRGTLSPRITHALGVESPEEQGQKTGESKLTRKGSAGKENRRRSTSSKLSGGGKKKSGSRGGRPSTGSKGSKASKSKKHHRRKSSTGSTII